MPETRCLHRVGPAGWHYPDWEGTVYTTATGSARLAYMARFFDCVEINVSFYRTPAPSVAGVWVRTVAAWPRFRFTAKLHQSFTHERRLDAGEARAFHAFLAPLAESGRLGALLLQFPWSFRADRENWDHARALFAEFRAYPLVVEVRHDSWWKPRFFDLLRELGVGIANIDQPALDHNVGPDAVMTGETLYIRFHGRNAANWWLKEQPYYGARYDYLYSAGELAPWIDRIRRAERQATNSFIIMNNHFRGEAVVNALELAEALGVGRGIVPAALAADHPGRLLHLGRRLADNEAAPVDDLFEGLV